MSGAAMLALALALRLHRKSLQEGAIAPVQFKLAPWMVCIPILIVGAVSLAIGVAVESVPLWARMLVLFGSLPALIAGLVVMHEWGEP